jgi:carboxynorspermidine decarboxylase
MAIDFSKIPSPCYVIEETRLRNNLALIKEVKDRSGAEIILAFKGFAMWGVFPILNEYGFKQATASSLSEARLAFEEMGAPAHTYAPVYTDDDIDGIIQLSSHITFNSIGQLERFRSRIKTSGKPISVGLRVNPEYSEVANALYNPCSPGSRLGILAENLGESLPEGVNGLHFHALCESDPTELQKVLISFEKLFGKYLSQVKWVNFGGGHLMTRKGYDTELLIKTIQDFKSRYPHLQVILEPGSAFAWDTGFLVSTVEDIVENKNTTTAILNISFTAHMPDCLEMPYQPMILGASDETVGKPTYRMGGNSCLAGDFMGNWSFEQPLKIGDQIVFNDMIHYTMVKTNTFNGVKHPSIGIWNVEKGFIIIREFGYEDYKTRLS